MVAQVQLSQIVFKKGIAYLAADGSKFSGHLVDILKSGTKINHTYSDGAIRNARGVRKDFSFYLKEYIPKDNYGRKRQVWTYNNDMLKSIMYRDGNYTLIDKIYHDNPIDVSEFNKKGNRLVKIEYPWLSNNLEHPHISITENGKTILDGFTEHPLKYGVERSDGLWTTIA